jgi:hypothetical protein
MFEGSYGYIYTPENETSSPDERRVPWIMTPPCCGQQWHCFFGFLIIPTRMVSIQQDTFAAGEFSALHTVGAN